LSVCAGRGDAVSRSDWLRRPDRAGRIAIAIMGCIEVCALVLLERQHWGFLPEWLALLAGVLLLLLGFPCGWLFDGSPISDPSLFPIVTLPMNAYFWGYLVENVSGRPIPVGTSVEKGGGSAPRGPAPAGQPLP